MPQSTEPGHTQATEDPAGASFSLRHGPSHLRLWTVAVLGLVLDLWSKHWAFSTLHGRRVVIPHLLHFHRSLNPGALFGLGHGMTAVFIVASVLALVFVLYLFAHTPRTRWSLHVALGMILAGALGNLYDRTFVTADAVWVRSSPGWRGWLGDEVVMTGKLIGEDDRAWIFTEWPEGKSNTSRAIPKQKGWYVRPSTVVRDFIKIDTAWLGYQVWKWVFNVADALLVVGVGLLLIHFWADRRQQHLTARAGGASPKRKGP